MYTFKDCSASTHHPIIKQNCEKARKPVTYTTKIIVYSKNFLMLDLLLILAIGVIILRCLLEQIVLVIRFVIDHIAMKTRSVLGLKGLIIEHSLAHTTVRQRTDCR